jgi:CBS-domain-containing membrane protein
MNPVALNDAPTATQTPVDVPRRRRFASRAPERPPVGQVFAIGGVVLLGLLVLVGIGELSGHLLLIPSMAGTMALVAAAPTFSLAQPRNVVLGQTLAAAIGLGVGVASHSLGAAAVSATLTVVLTLLARCAHAPAAATAVLATITVAERGWFFACAVAAALAIVLTAATAARCTRQGYPTYWW